MKKCSKCEVSKPFSAFARRALSADGLQCWCRECKSRIRSGDVASAKRYEAGWRAKNRGRVQVIRQRFEAAHQPRLVESKRQWALDNPTTNRLSKQQWAQSNRPKVAAKEARREATKRQATPAWSDQHAVEEFYLTAAGLSMWTGEWHHVDHVVPLRSATVCGLHCPANLQVLSGTENRIKSNRHWPDQP